MESAKRGITYRSRNSEYMAMNEPILTSGSMNNQ